MTIDETKMIIAVIQVTYPSHYRNIKPTQIDTMVNLWYRIFADKRYQVVSNAIDAFISTDTKGFPPMPGNINEMISSVNEMANINDQIDENEAWTLVYKAIQNSVYNSGEEFAKLPPLVQQAINNPDNLKNMAMTQNFNMDVESSNFKRAFNTVKKREQGRAKMPSRVLLAAGNNEDFKPQISVKNDEPKQIEQSDYEPVTDTEQLEQLNRMFLEKLGGGKK